MKQTTNRTLISVYIPHELAEWLKQKSDDTGAPMSRLIEKALTEYKNKSESPR